MAPKRPVEVLTLSSDDEEDHHDQTSAQNGFEADLARAIALSKQEAAQESKLEAKAEPIASASTGPSTQASSSAVPSRAELERERLLRQQQREASGTITQTARVGPAAKRPRVATLSDVSDATAADPITSSSGQVHVFASSNGSGSSSARKFWDGAVKRVANDNVPDNDSCSFASIINGGEELEMAIVGAYCLDLVWVCSHFQQATELLLVMPRSQGDKEGPLAQISELIKDNTYRVIPAMSGVNAQYSCMHTKIIVLYFKSFIRIVIPTANAVDYDWSIVDNALYVHDFPLRRNTMTIAPDPRDNPTHTQFSLNFLEVMHTLGVPKRFVFNYRKWDFSSSNKVRLIASVQGNWHGWEEIKKGGGVPGLATQVKSLGFTSGGKWQIEAQCSSLGNFTVNWLAQMMGACEGMHPKRYFTKKQPTPPHHPQAKPSVPTTLPIKIVYPTFEEIDGSWGGQGHGGTIFCRKATWALNNFPRHLFYKGVSKRHRVAAHTKTIVAIRKPISTFETDFKHEGWMYLGSHNFTQAAWGKLQIASRDGEPELVNNNHELGVLIPIRGISAEDVEKKASELATYRRPLVKYGSKDLPWMQDAQPQSQ